MGNKKTTPTEIAKILNIENTASVEVLAPVLAEHSKAVAAEVIEMIDDIATLNDDAVKLNEEITTLNDDAVKLNEEITTLNDDAVKLNEEIVSLKAEVSVFEGTIKELTKTIEEMGDLKKVTNAEVKDTPTHMGKTFTLDDDEYGFNYPKTTLKREPITVDDVLASEDLQRTLISMKSGMIFKK